MCPVVPVERRRRKVLQKLVDLRRRLLDVDVAHEVVLHEVVERAQLALTNAATGGARCKPLDLQGTTL